MRSRHTGERKFVCDHSGCSAGYFSSGALQQHKSASHSTQEVSCEFCGKCYRSAFNLRAHLRLSHREGTIPCELCGKKFITVRKLYFCYRGILNEKVHHFRIII